MFTGLVQNTAPVIQTQKKDSGLEITLGVLNESSLEDSSRKNQVGDSVAVDGVCLTLEKTTPKEMKFTLGRETLQVTAWNSDSLKGKKMNIESSLKVGDPVGGQWLTGHVDGKARVEEAFFQDEKLIVSLPQEFEKFIFRKGWIALNGVSLTIHEVIEKNKIRLGIIPETLKRTNLKYLQKGSFVTFEVCYTTRVLVHLFEEKMIQKSS